MIKVQNNVAFREDLPKFLQGLARESLADLSWTDPALEVQNLAWWPEDNQTQPLGENEKYGEEVLTVDADRKVVVSVLQVVPMTQEEIDARTVEQNAAKAEQRKQITAQIADLNAQLQALE